MKDTKPRFVVSNPDAPINFMHLRIVTTEIDGELYVFYKHEDGSTMLMSRDTYYEYVGNGLIPEPGYPEDIPNVKGKYL